MKKYFIQLLVILTVVFLLNGCNSKVDNEVKFENLTMMTIHVNFLSSDISVPSDETKILSDLPRGTYSYSTSYDIPDSAKSSSEKGEVSGVLTLKAGTKILILYKSTFINGNYVVSATISSNEELEDGINP